MQGTIRGRSCGWGLIVGLLLLAGGSVRGEADGKSGEGIWKGREETRDGVVWVWNPDEPLRGERTVELTARWSVLQSPDAPEEDVASSDSMPLMGTLSDVVLASDGTIYALDSQLKCIHAFDAQGHYLRALSRPGQGPGELSQPNGLLAPAPDLLVLDGMPSRLVGLHADGTPAGNLVPGFGEASGAL
ncbi:MAG: 6-bladed beta-propeller, partial [Candidatus Eisenbacteria bacterium]